MLGRARALRALVAAAAGASLRRPCTLPRFPGSRRLLASTAAGGPDDASLEFFRSIIGDRNVLVAADELTRYNADWLNIFYGEAQAVLRPRTTEEVAAVLAHCDDQRIGVVPLGGNTGLVGGGVARDGSEVVLSLDRMRDVVSFDEESAVLVCEAGCVLHDADDFLNRHGFTMPIDLAAKGSCAVGGNVATNAGGVRMVRYGNLHGRVVGLEVVLPSGQVVDTTRDTLKDNTGLHIKSLFVGSEGTLGVITKVAILAAPRPRHARVALLAAADFDGVRKLVRRAKAELGEVVAALEYMDRDAFQASLDYVAHLRGSSCEAVSPFATKDWGDDDTGSTAPPFVFLVETAGCNAAHDDDKFDGFLSHVMEEGLVLDGVLANSERQYQDLWDLRELAASALSHGAHLYSHDVSLPVREFDSYVQRVRDGIAARCPGREGLHVCGFGHLGDGNLHITVRTPEFDEEVHHATDDLIYGLLRELYDAGHNVSPSAEHGIGQQKLAKLGLVRSEEHVELLRRVKAVFDPNNIMNPGKVLR